MNRSNEEIEENYVNLEDYRSLLDILEDIKKMGDQLKKEMKYTKMTDFGNEVR